MQFREQGTIGNARYTVVPRTLSFILCGEMVLLLRGAPTKRLWPGRLNGLGGHLEPGEDPRAGALREIREESGLQPEDLTLRALVHVSGHLGYPGVLLFVFVGHALTQQTVCGDEGAVEWHPVTDLPWDEMVPDLAALLPRLLGSAAEGLLYGVYDAGTDGEIAYRWAGPRPLNSGGDDAARQ